MRPRGGPWSVFGLRRLFSLRIRARSRSSSGVRVRRKSAHLARWRAAFLSRVAAWCAWISSSVRPTQRNTGRTPFLRRILDRSQAGHSFGLLLLNWSVLRPQPSHTRSGSGTRLAAL